MILNDFQLYQAKRPCFKSPFGRVTQSLTQRYPVPTVTNGIWMDLRLVRLSDVTGHRCGYIGQNSAQMKYSTQTLW